jgi:putative aldouronate transport system permease protein
MNEKVQLSMAARETHIPVPSVKKPGAPAPIRALSSDRLGAHRSGAASVKRFFVKYRYLHLLVLPGVAYFLVFCYLPMFGVLIAFNDYSGMGGILGMITAPGVGLKHFIGLFQSMYFWRLLRNTVILSSLRLLFGFPAPILLAILLSEIRYRHLQRVVQTVSYLPHFLSWVVISGLAAMLLGAEGPVNSALGQLFGVRPIIFLSDSRYFRGVLVSSGIWQSVGWNSIIFFAAISNVPPEHYEVAIVEGASRWQRARYVTLPWLSVIIVILLVLNIGQIINEDFEQIFNLYNPAVYDVADVFETYIYRKGLYDRNFSYATAAGLFKSVISFAMVVGANRIAKALQQEGLW